MKFEDVTKGQKVVVLNKYRMWGECEVVDMSPPQSVIVKDARSGKNHFTNCGQLRISKGRTCGVWITTDYKTKPPTTNVLIRYPEPMHAIFTGQVEGMRQMIEDTLNDKDINPMRKQK
jgi:hypothetical protein